jgi:hypothetical protein
MKAITSKRISNVLYTFFAIVILYILTVSTVACNNTPINDNKPEKPFIIIGKNYHSNYKSNKVTYSYLDKNLNIFYFQDSESKYSVGDTIK